MTDTLLLIRHALPDESIQEDAVRPLSQAGKAIQYKMAYALLKQGIHIDYLLHSPYTRTAETAQIIAEVFQISSEAEPLLAPQANEKWIYEKAIQLSGTVALVGHAPSLFNLAMLFFSSKSPSFHLERSGTLKISLQEPVSWQYYSPRTLLV